MTARVWAVSGMSDRSMSMASRCWGDSRVMESEAMSMAGGTHFAEDIGEADVALQAVAAKAGDGDF